MAEEANEPTQEAFAAAIENALAGVVPGEMVNRWVFIVETIGPDGDRGVWLQAPPGAKPWDTLGLLRHAEHVELAATIREHAHDDDDDEDGP